MTAAYHVGQFYIQDTTAPDCLSSIYSFIAGPPSAVQQQSTCKLYGLARNAINSTMRSEIFFTAR